MNSRPGWGYRKRRKERKGRKNLEIQACLPFQIAAHITSFLHLNPFPHIPRYLGEKSLEVFFCFFFSDRLEKIWDSSVSLECV